MSKQFSLTNNSNSSLTSNQLLKASSAGLALQGIFLSKDRESLFKERLPLIRVEKTVDLINPSHPEIDRNRRVSFKKFRKFV